MYDGQKWLYNQELELQNVVNHHVPPGNASQVFSKSNECS